MRTLRRLALLAAASAFLLLLHMLLLAGAAPLLRTARIALPGWPEGAPPLRVVLLSDLHLATRGDTPARLATTLARVNALHPDLVLVAGDFTGSGTVGADELDPDATARPLAGLRAPLGVWAVLGNHDVRTAAALRPALARAGVHVLSNRAARVGPLALIVVGDAFSGANDLPRALANWRQLPPGGVPVMLTHSPDIVPDLPPGIPLALAGHTHCGQVRLPGIGAPKTQSRYRQRYGCGPVREGNRLTIVSAGLGTSSLPVRLGAPPDLWLLTLGG